MIFKRNVKANSTLFCLALLGTLSGCMAHDVERSEQQERMLRCDQYIGEQREKCLRGETVTIDEYKDEVRKLKKQQQKELEEKELEQ